MICASSVGFSALDRTSCAQSVFQSRVVTSGFAIAEALGVVVAGQGQVVGGAQVGPILGGAFDPGNVTPFVRALGGPDGFQGTADDPFPFMQAAFGVGALGIPNCFVAGRPVRTAFPRRSCRWPSIPMTAHASALATSGLLLRWA